MKHFIYCIIFITLTVIGTNNVKADNYNMIAEQNSTKTDTMLIKKFVEKGMRASSHNEVTVIKSGKEKFCDLFEEVSKAKHHIHLEYFNFRNDSISNGLFELLEEKVKQGVEVRAIFDAFGNMSNSKPINKKKLKELNSKGIKIAKFDPLNFPYINHALHRDHRKIVVIDGKVGYTGGMNIANYYIYGTKKIGQWRDTHLKIRGEAVNVLQEIFLDMWKRTTKEEVKGEQYFPTHDTLDYKNNITLAIADRVPKKTNAIIRDGYEIAINNAKDSLSIVNPYFVPTNKIFDSLKKAIDRGVNVSIMISADADIPFTPDAALYKLNKLMKRGANVYIYKGGFHHSKIMMVDGSYCTVGTANLNSRSLRYDFETNVFIFDKGITNELQTTFNNDVANCVKMTPEFWQNRTCWKKFVSWFANIFTPFL